MRPCQIDLCDLIAAPEIHERLRDIAAFEYPRFDVHIAGEIQVPLERVPLGLRQPTQVVRRMHRDREAFRAEKIARPLGAPDQHGGLRIGRDQDEDPVLLSRIMRNPMLHFVVRWGKTIAMALACIVAAAGIWAALSAGNVVWALLGLGAGVIGYGVALSYVELVRLVMDMLLPK